jgi:hypothetical protein
MKDIVTRIPTEHEYGEIASAIGTMLERRDNGDQYVVGMKDGSTVELPSRAWWRIREDS